MKNSGGEKTRSNREAISGPRRKEKSIEGEERIGEQRR